MSQGDRKQDINDNYKLTTEEAIKIIEALKEVDATDIDIY